MKRSWKVRKVPIDELDRSAPYFVPDEQLAIFGKLTPIQRLEWLDEARLFTIKASVRLHRPRKSKYV